MRKNNKQHLIDFENTIMKSNELSVAKLNQGLTLNQIQLLAFAIFSYQKNGKSEFIKADFERKFGIERYKTGDAEEDVPKLRTLHFKFSDPAKDSIDEINVFQRITYDRGNFTFKWSEDMLPHIIELKEKYIMTDLTITSKFRSSFSWVLYDYLKGHYGYWHKVVSKDDLMELFGVTDVATYKKNTSRFKQSVLDIALRDLNEFTELEVRYKEIRVGRAIVSFDLIWSTGERIDSASKKQIDELVKTLEAIHEDMFRYINLKNDKFREEAIELIRKSEARFIEVKSKEIQITKKRADFLMMESRAIFLRLEDYVKSDQNGASSVPLYNWLEERGT